MIKIWNIVNGMVIITFIGHTKTVRSVVPSIDGRLIFSGSSDKTIKVWKLK